MFYGLKTIFYVKFLMTDNLMDLIYMHLQILSIENAEEKNKP